MIRLRLLFMLLLFAGLPGCTGGTEPATESAAAEPEPNTPTNRVAIPVTVRRNLDMSFATVEKRHVARTFRVPGAFELQPLARHEYRMVLPGSVEFLVEQYQPVEPGMPLYRFRSPKWPELQHEIIQGEQSIASGRAGVEVAEATLVEARAKLDIVQERIDTLAAAEFKRADLEAQAAELRASIPRLEAEVSVARTALANARLTYEHALHRASAAIGLDESVLTSLDHHDSPLPHYRLIEWIGVLATEPGVVERLAITDGAYVEAPGLVLSTVDPTRLRFRAVGLQSDLAQFTGGITARIVPAQTVGTDMAESIEASVTLGLEAHPDQRTVTLIALPSDVRSWSRPGVSAFLEIVTESSGGPTLAIPSSTVLKDGLEHVFFRRDPANPDEAIRVAADLGVDDGRWVVVNSGVRLGDEIVLDGAYELKLATSRSGTTQKGGHFHADGTFHGEDH